MENGMKTQALKSQKWLKGLLIASLLVNVALAGSVVGGLWRHRAPDPRDMGLGPVAFALSSEQRQSYRAALMQKLPDLRRGRESLRADFEALQAALTAQPYDGAAAEAALSFLFQRTHDRLTASHAVLAEVVNHMSETERAEFAKKLADMMSRAPKKDRPAPAPRN